MCRGRLDEGDGDDNDIPCAGIDNAVALQGRRRHDELSPVAVIPPSLILRWRCGTNAHAVAALRQWQQAMRCTYVQCGTLHISARVLVGCS